MSNLVAIVGRPNVGKSTLFNRLTETRHAIVDSVSGVTRDRHYGKVFWNGEEFSVVDTGGYILGSEDVFEQDIRDQVMIAIEEADLILFMVDIADGITPMDEDVANVLRKTDKEVMLVANKADNSLRMAQASEFYALGLGDVTAISSANGSGTGELLDEVVDKLDFTKKEEDIEGLPRIAIVGKPNVGKSSLVNSLLEEERNIVTDIAGTTRDTLNIRYNKYGHDFMLMDTAGIRRKSRVNENIEFYSVMRSVNAIESSDVCILMVDANLGIEAQDMNIFSMIVNNRRGVVIFVNKWDVIEKETNTMKEMEDILRKRIAPFTDVPIIFGSATNKQRIMKVLDAAKEVYHNRTKKIPTHKLNDVMLEVIEHHRPPAYKGKYIKIKFVTQLPTYAPSFAFFCNLPQYVRDPYKRYLENKLREHFDFSGVPIQIFFRKK